ncbi:MAG: tRNA 2-thiocytidine biosynthesis protein TtcA [Lachnospiraceae bacterium]|nr:tRNA 2-thiocytidine biosynthesis protein TtcA [Lachnospiraceae bacterium]
MDRYMKNENHPLEASNVVPDRVEESCAANSPSHEQARREQIEKSLSKKFKKDIFSRFTKAIVDYELVREGDKIAVCISGGKDSMCMAKLFQELKKHDKFPFELVFLVMDPGYSDINRKMIESNAALMGIPLEIFETRIFDAVDNIDKSPCYLCARMRRGYLYRRAQDLGCNKIALGHHFDDVIETVLMGMLYSGQYQSMMPKLHSTNFPGMELIRPMYLVRESDIESWRDYNGLTFLRCACRFTEAQEMMASGRSVKEGDSKRLETKRLIAELKKTNPFVEANIFKATQNVVLNKVLGYKQHGEKHSFLEDY